MIQKKLLILIMLAISLASCAPLKPLEFKSVTDVSIKNVLSKPEASVNLNLFNPNSYGGKLKDVDIQFSLGGVLLSEVSIAKVTHVPANKEFTVPVTGITSASELLKFLPAGINSFLSGKDIPLFVSGKVTVKKFLFMKTIPFEFKDTVSSKDIQLK